MKLSLTKNWPAKLASLAAAFVIWYVIHQHISDGMDFRFRDQELLEKQRQQKLQELMSLDNLLNEIKIEKASKAIPVDEETEVAPPAPQSPTP
jgi:hypothetical protein